MAPGGSRPNFRMKALWIGVMVAASMTTARTAAAATTVYVNADGASLTAGSEDASRNRSGIVASEGLRRLDVPAYSGSAAARDRLLGCVQAHFAAFDVEVVDARPAGADYVMAVVGGRPQMLGYPDGIGGIGPFSGDVVHGAIVFAFERGHPTEQSLCETTAHEIGHALGLDHSRRCDDLMSYGQCGPKRFRDTAASCGEFSDRTCYGGAATQSSTAKLASTVGWKRAPVVEPVPATPPVTREPRRPPRTRGPAGPRGQDGRDRVTVGTSAARAHGVFEIEVTASVGAGVAAVDLIWAQPGRTRRLRCGQSNSRLPYTCVRRGDRYIFSLAVGRGARQFAVRVTDGAGLAHQTKTIRRVF
jgi:hypothetical protein